MTWKIKHGTPDCCGNHTLFSSMDMVVMAAKRSFRDAWLNNEDFQPWLSCVEDIPSRAFCKICKREVSAELTAIKHHKTTKMHSVYEASEQQEVQQEWIPVHHGNYAANGVAFACEDPRPPPLPQGPGTGGGWPCVSLGHGSGDPSTGGPPPPPSTKKCVCVGNLGQCASERLQNTALPPSVPGSV
ncbi:hypothetical protein Hamer_G002021 [Homarus americanus]|uniref:Uncharacterized protein n=1 Tax=Homarus americanus TaxID=6706 RepID=A0A8J5JWW0_HOMAM|nr:hypothetical protein Hamer_G002021 [Homarus americanus]